MKIKTIGFFLFAVGLSLLVAHHRWGDSGHALASITAGGGKIRHPVHLSDSYGLYSVIVTARILPPYHGNTRVVLEGASNIPHEIHFSKPVIDLGFRELSEYRDHTLYGLKPGHRIALWVVIRPEDSDRDKQSENFKGALTLALNDTNTGKSVLKVPLLFGEMEEKKNGQRRHNH